LSIISQYTTAADGSTYRQPILQASQGEQKKKDLKHKQIKIKL